MAGRRVVLPIGNISGYTRETFLDMPNLYTVKRNDKSRMTQSGLMNEKLNDDQLELYETSTHPFILKIWLVEVATKARQATWHGSIVHVPSGRRQPLKDLDDVVAFVAPYLEAMGVKLGLCWRVRLWLRRWKS